MHKIVFSLKAREDMHAIRDFIAKDNPLYAEKVMQSLFSSCMQLAYFPAMGSSLSESIRMLVEPAFRYNILYRILGDVVQIVSVSKYKDIR